LHSVNVNTDDVELVFKQEEASSAITAAYFQNILNVSVFDKADEFRWQWYQIGEFPFSARNHLGMKLPLFAIKTLSRINHDWDDFQKSRRME
jgi:hypothetical protein